MEYDERGAKQTRWEKGKKQIHWKACFNSAIKLHPFSSYSSFSSYDLRFSWETISCLTDVLLVGDNSLFSQKQYSFSLSLFKLHFPSKIPSNICNTQETICDFFSNCCFNFLKKKKSVLFCFFSPVHSAFH